MPAGHGSRQRGTVDPAIRWRRKRRSDSPRGSGLRGRQLSIPVCRSVGPAAPAPAFIPAIAQALPAAGLRNNNSGQFANTSTNGYYWSSSPNYGGNRNAGNLNFNASNVNPLNNNNRSNGFPVRCVRASAGLFFIPHRTVHGPPRPVEHRPNDLFTERRTIKGGPAYPECRRATAPGSAVR